MARRHNNSHHQSKYGKTRTKVRKTMTELETTGYRLNPKKCKFFKNTPFTGQLERNNKDQYSKERKRTEIIPTGAIQYLSKQIENLSTNTDILRKQLKKQNDLIRTEERIRACNNVKECLRKIPYLAHYNANNDNIILFDASTKGLYATLW